MNPWLSIPAEDYRAHMEHEFVAQGALLRRHLEDSVLRYAPKSMMFLGAGIGNGLESPAMLHVQDILAIDVNPSYLEFLTNRFAHLPIRTHCCEFPNQFESKGRFDVVYGALFFEYVDLHATLACIKEQLNETGKLIVLLQQPSITGNVTNTGVDSLNSLRGMMTILTPDDFTTVAEAIGYYPESQKTLVQRSKEFVELVLKLE